MYKPPKRRKLTKRERQVVYDKCGGHCAYCGAELPISRMQVDHVDPIALTGEDTLDNMLPSCRSCNNYKHTLTLEKFRQAIERWPEVLARDNVTYRNAIRFGMVEPRPHKVMFFFERITKEEARHDQT